MLVLNSQRVVAAWGGDTGLAEIAAWIELVIPNLAGGCTFLEEKHHGLHACALEGTAGAVEDGVQVAAFQ